jgi:NADH dehydrogenase
MLIDRENFHTFTPLLYQVATAALDPSEIAYPVRTIFRKRSNVRFLWAEVTDIDHEQRALTVRADGDARTIGYDYLLLCAGSVTNFFGNADIAALSFELKTLRHAVVLRNHLLKLFERAAWTDDADERARLTTIVVVGGGATGLETAGALYELYNHVLRKEYPGQDLRARVLLVEAAPALLAGYPESLQQAALAQVESLGVEVVFGNPVAGVSADQVTLRDGTVIASNTLVWSAGVQASPLARSLGVELSWQGRVPVARTLEVIGRERVYVTGDMAYLEDESGAPYVGVIQVAKQESQLAAKNILRDLAGKERQEFRYRDYGIMATIGRRRAVAWLFKRIRMRGFLAWMAWLFLHLIMLMGFRNRLNVFVNWMWNYITYDRSVRIILEHRPHVVDRLMLAPNRTRSALDQAPAAAPEPPAALQAPAASEAPAARGDTV